MLDERFDLVFEIAGKEVCSRLRLAKDPRQAKREFEAAYQGSRHAAARSAGMASFQAGFPSDALEWLRKDTGTPISSFYWQYRVLDGDPLLQRNAGERDELLQMAADAGHVWRSAACRQDDERPERRRCLGSGASGVCSGIFSGVAHRQTRCARSAIALTSRQP